LLGVLLSVLENIQHRSQGKTPAIVIVQYDKYIVFVTFVVHYSNKSVFVVVVVVIAVSDIPFHLHAKYSQNGLVSINKYQYNDIFIRNFHECM